MKLTTRQREAVVDAAARDGRVAAGLHRTTRDKLVDKGLAEWRDGIGYVLTAAGRAAAVDPAGRETSP